MELKDFLDQNKIIKLKGLSELMYPGNKSPYSKLRNKLDEKVVGSGKQRITENDKDAAIAALTKVRDDIDNYIKANKKD